MAESTDYRARILAALERSYSSVEDVLDWEAATKAHEGAADAISDILRDLTRDLSEQVAQLKLADAHRAAREGKLEESLIHYGARCEEYEDILDEITLATRKYTGEGELVRPAPDSVGAEGGSRLTPGGDLPLADMPDADLPGMWERADFE